MIRGFDFVLSSADMELLIRCLSETWKQLPDGNPEKEKIEELLKEFASAVLADYGNQPGGAVGGDA